MKRGRWILVSALVGIAIGVVAYRLWVAAVPRQDTPVEATNAPVATPPPDTNPDGELPPPPDFSLPETGEIIDLVLADLFSNPKSRDKALALLNDIPSEVPGTPRPPLDAVVMDSRRAPPGYTPRVKDVPFIIADLGKRRPLRQGEIGLDVGSFKNLPGDSVELELYGVSYGYSGNEFAYRVVKESGRWRVEFLYDSKGP